MKKEAWELALEKFIGEWESKKEVVGAVACGSFITGNPSKHSDIDIQILLDSKVKWRERGNKIVGGFLIEYFANPYPQNMKYFGEDYKSRKKMNVHMFLTGKVLFDKNGDVKRIIKMAKAWDKNKFEKLNKVRVELAKYSIWDMKDNLEEVCESNKEDFYFVYYNYLNELFDSYSKFLGFYRISPNKLVRFLSDKKDRAKYRMPGFPDKNFAEQYLTAVRLKDRKEMLEIYRKLTDYVLGKMGGFEIDGWKVRSSVEN